MSRSTGIVLAVLGAVLSAALLFVYVQGAEDRARGKEEQIQVLVALSAIPQSTPFESAYNGGMIGFEDVPSRLVPTSAVTDPNALVGQLAINDIPAGIVMVDELFATAEEIGARALGPPTLAREIPDGRVAVTISVGSQAAVADLIRPGDRVNLLIQVPNTAEIGLPDAGGPAVVHIFQNLEIFAIGQSASNGPAGQAAANPGGGLYTVLVDPLDSARLVFLTAKYPVTLALVNPTYEPERINPVTGVSAIPAGLTPEASAERNG